VPISRAPIRCTSATFKSVVALILTCVAITPSEVHADFNSATGEWDGDVSATTFDEFCRGDLPPELRSRFSSALDVADSALASGNAEAAKDAFGEARGAAYRGGGDSDISIKCLGVSSANRWFESQLELNRQQSRVDARGSQDETAALYVTAVEEGGKAVVQAVGMLKPRRFVASIGNLESIALRIENERKFGAFILDKEDALARTCREAVISLRRRASQEHQQALREEEEAFNRPMTEAELEASASVESASDLAKTLIGIGQDGDLEATWDREAVHIGMRASQSLDNLRRARVWNLKYYEDRQTMPSSQRARKRGDEMLSRAAEQNSSLGLRDAAYQEAQRYYDFGGFKEASASTKAAHESIEPALAAARERQNERLDEAASRMGKRKESIQRGVEEMTKSEAEKKSFEEEADALEDELGF
jgi:hypothetical protein